MLIFLGFDVYLKEYWPRFKMTSGSLIRALTFEPKCCDLYIAGGESADAAETDTSNQHFHINCN